MMMKTESHNYSTYSSSSNSSSSSSSPSRSSSATVKSRIPNNNNPETRSTSGVNPLLTLGNSQDLDDDVLIITTPTTESVDLTYGFDDCRKVVDSVGESASGYDLAKPRMKSNSNINDNLNNQSDCNCNINNYFYECDKEPTVGKVPESKVSN